MAPIDRHAVLLCVDMQRGFDEPSWPARNNPLLDDNGLKLLAAWRRRGWPVVHVRHDSATPGSALFPGLPGNRFREGFEPLAGEALVVKSVNSAFIGTDLDLRLRRMGATRVVAFGISTDMCVSTTVRTGANMGWDMTLVSDACATFDRVLDGEHFPAETMHRVHLATLGAEFCTLATTAEMVGG